jgi:hypothetical protein
MLPLLQLAAKRWLSDIYWFSRLVIRRPLYAYQLEPARAILDSVLNQRGLEFAIMFPRQSGKNETQAQVEAYLLNLFQNVPGAQIVKAQPTFRPQAINAKMRLERALGNDWNLGAWRSRQGYMLQVGQAVCAFFSAEPAANAVGATANLLLECDEAQDVLEAEWDKKFVPMAASTNATIVYWGTAWTSRTLLARAIRRLRQQEARDGLKRVFIVTPEQVASENPAYGAFVARQVERQGRQHPLVRTQFYNEEIDAEGGMFPPARLALMRGTHPQRSEPEPGKVYALLLDVAGEDEGAGRALHELGDPAAAALVNPRRDATALTIVEVDLATLEDPLIAAPTYKAVSRHLWVGTRHSTLYAQIVRLAQHWQARYLVADATGVGAGLVSFLSKALPAGQAQCAVIPFEFTGHSKSQLGWDFLAIVEAGRWQDYAPAQARFFNELAHCQYEVVPGPAHLLRWGVPDGTRDEASGELVHDDTVLSAALAAVLDAGGRDGRTPWPVPTGPAHIIRGHDPLDEMSRGY